MNRSYSELILLNSFEERFDYLKLDGVVGVDTFGFDRYLNQMFYKSKEWRTFRNEIIIRDFGCDLGIEGYEIFGKILIHHINPITPKDITERKPYLIDPDNVICTSFETHQAIHYGSESLLREEPINRMMNDTCPWRK